MSSIIPNISGGEDATLENDFFRQATRYIYGLEITQSPSTASIKEADRLWNAFLSKIGKTNDEFKLEVGAAKLPSERTAAEQAAIASYTALYNNFLVGKLEYVYRSNAINLLSPEEIDARNILFETFELVLKMLNALQQNLKLSAKAYEFYTKWQDQYSKQMAHTPMYFLKPKLTGSGNLEDIGKAEISGYAHITVGDVLRYLTEHMIEDGATEKSWQPDTGWPDYPKTDLRFVLTQGTDGSGHKTLTFTATMGTAYVTYNDSLFNVTINEGTDTVPLATSDNLRSAMNMLLKKATDQLNNKTGYIIGSSGTTWADLRNGWVAGTASPSLMTQVEWQSIVKESTQSDQKAKDEENKNRQQTRGELNGVLQLYLDNARSRRTMIQNKSKPVEDLISQCRESIQAQQNLANTVIDTLRGLLSAITRV